MSEITLPYSPVPRRWIDTEPVEPDDMPCSLERIDVSAEIRGVHALVVEELTISNPNPRPLSAALEIALPDRAVVCGYALDVDGQMVDGVVVPKELGRVAFETEQRKGADPGLAEAVRGGVHRVRVYPVPARGERIVRLSFAVPLAVSGTSAHVDLPMPAEDIGRRTVRIEAELPGAAAPRLSGALQAPFERAGMAWVAESDESGVTGGAPLRVALPQLPDSFEVVERDPDGNVWFCASELAPAPPADVPVLPPLAVLWDASGSRAGDGHARELELLAAYVGKSGRGAFAAFSDTVSEPVAFRGFEELEALVGSVRYDGATDFSALSGSLPGIAAAAGDGCAALLFTDGMGTLGGELSVPAGMPAVAILSGACRDAEAMRRACHGTAVDAGSAPGDARGLAELLLDPRVLRGVECEGVSLVSPAGSAADGRFTVVGMMMGDVATVSLGGGGEHVVDASGARDGLALSRAWAAGRVAELSGRASENAAELADLGRRFGIVSPVTSLLVLETLEQWLEYDIEPPASWAEMRGRWEKAVRGRMSHSSEQARRAEHRAALARGWAEVMSWHGRDFPEAGPAPTGFCPSCGARQAFPQGRFCPSCGSPLTAPDEGAAAPSGIRGALRGGPFGAVLDRFAPARASSMRMAASNAPAASMPARSFAVGAMAQPAFSAAAMPMEESMDMAAPMEMAAPGDTGAPGPAGAVGASVHVRAWTPDASYIDEIGRASDPEEAYFSLRPSYADSPAFFIDCSTWFASHGMPGVASRILGNLAEMRIDDAALLKVLEWRLRELGELDRALEIALRVRSLRPEDSQGHRDVALLLSELARRAFADGDEAGARSFAEESGKAYRETALTPWARRPMAIGLFAVEEYNVLRAWASSVEWGEPPALEPLGDGLEGVPDCDLRVTLAWDADETDVDLHVTEPGGEEAYYGNRLTHSGGRVSEDITDGYGPELYEIRHAREGSYKIRAHYYASHQQAVFGPASCTLTVYTDWGRPGQSQSVTSTRLDREREMVDVGSAEYSRESGGKQVETGSVGPVAEGGGLRLPHRGDDVGDVIGIYGEPDERVAGDGSETLVWRMGGREVTAVFDANGLSSFRLTATWERA